jgi:glucose/arabinose dehydrogenase
MGTSSPEFKSADCTKYTKPVVLLPPHAAPLGMTYYFGRGFPPEYAGSLLIAYHGYRKYGHRIVAISADQDGMPRAAPRDLVSDWGARSGQRMGAPVDIKVGADGAAYISEDRNGTVLRLFYGG